MRNFPIAALTSAVPDERLPLPAGQAGDGVRVDGVVAVEAVAGVAGVPGVGRGEGRPPAEKMGGLGNWWEKKREREGPEGGVLVDELE